MLNWNPEVGACRQTHLTLRITKAAVELEDFWSLFGQHKTCIQHAWNTEQISEQESSGCGARYNRFSRLANIRRSFLPHPVDGLLQNSLSDLLQQLLTHLCRTAAPSEFRVLRLNQEKRRTSGLPEGWGSKPPCHLCLDPGHHPAAAYGPELEAWEPQRNRQWNTNTVGQKPSLRHTASTCKVECCRYSQTLPPPPGALPPRRSLLQSQMLHPATRSTLKHW